MNQCLSRIVLYRSFLYDSLISLPTANFTKPRKLLNPELSNEIIVTTQMKALDEYFLVVVFTLLLNRVHVFANFMFNSSRKTW